MRNVLDKRCRENQNTHFMFNNGFSKIVPFMRQCRKIWWSQTGHKWRHNTAHTVCMLDKQGYIHACARTRPRARAHARARARTHNYVIFIAFPQQQWFSKAPQCFTYIVSLVIILNSTRHCMYSNKYDTRPSSHTWMWLQEKGRNMCSV